MPVSSQNMELTASLTVIRDTDADATSEADVNTGAATLYIIQIDNSANSTQAVFLKLYNATAPTIGTTAPDFVLRVAGGATVRLAIAEGLSFPTGLSFACVTAGGTGGTTSPTSDVSVVLVVS